MRNVGLGLGLLSLLGLVVWLSAGTGCVHAESCKAMGSVGAITEAKPDAGSKIGDGARAFDGLLNTYALLQPASTLGGGSIRGTIDGARVLQGKRRAGVLLGAPAEGQQLKISITTFLNGGQQDRGSPREPRPESSGELCGSSCETRDGLVFYAIDTELPFNAIQATVEVSGGSQPVQIRELCHQ